MPQVSQHYFKAAALFLLASIAIGLQMSISGEHNVAGAHAHMSLLGWVSCAVFGAYFALNKEKAKSVWTTVQFWIVVVSCAVMTGALYLLLLGNTAMAPVVAAGSIAYAVGATLFAWIVFSRQEGDVAIGGHAHG
jgi:anti-sigma-K factor RskA